MNIFYATINSQLQELNGQFSEHATQLLILSLVLDSLYASESFRINDICQQAKKFYPQDFIDYDKVHL